MRPPFRPPVGALRPGAEPDTRPGVAARLAAAGLLSAVLDERQTLDDALAGVAAFDALEGSDRGFARAMASATLRELGRIDAALSGFLDRPIADTPAPVLALLRIGAAQLWCLDTPAHAAVSETVAAARAHPEANRASGFLNAVLRRAAEAGEVFAALAPEMIWPDWLRAAFRDSLGAEATDRLARAQLAPPDLDLTLKAPHAGEWALRLGGVALGDFTVRLSGQPAVEALPGYEAGEWWVQDRAAQLPARLLGDVAGRRVIDLCAAPGGKTLQLAASGADTVAVDRARKRLRRLRENARRTDLLERIEIVEADAAAWRPAEPAGHVLLDAPCSALGTLRRHPEGAWIKSPAELARFPAVQADLLRAGLGMLAPGGRLVYCVCTPIEAEGRAVVAGAIAQGLAHREPVMAGELDALAAPGRWLTPEGDLLTLPDPDVADGLNDAFYIARLTRA